ncbi:MAG: glutathione peroxidase [Rhodoferax sp.]|nr:glutathione peroxidase [Rhodoferax sp.]
MSIPRRLPLLLAWLVAATAAWCLPSGARAQSKAAPAACPPLLQHRFDRLQDEAPQDLCQFAGKVVLVVNTASYCGFTGQYEGLEKLFARYEKRGLVVLGFPSNDFGQQEPGSSKEIADLCFNTYAVRFPMFSRTVVSGPGRNDLYAGLYKATGVAPGWNFHKYLIDRSGVVVANFASPVEPTSAAVIDAVERALRK